MEDEKTTKKEASSLGEWVLVGCSMFLMLIAWICATFNGWYAVAFSLLSVIVGVFSLRSGQKPVRNLAITSMLSAAVLLVVVGAFMLFLKYGLD